MNVLEMIKNKDQENELKKQKTIEIYNAIKDELLEDLIKESIDSGFSQNVHVFSMRIVDSILKSIGCQDLNSGVFWVGFKLVGWNTISRSPLYHWTHLDLIDSSVQEREKQVKEICNSFDYGLLELMLCSYFESKGFKALRATNRFTWQSGKLMQFSISKGRLLKLSNNSDVDNIEYPVSITFLIFLVLFIIILLSLLL